MMTKNLRWKNSFLPFTGLLVCLFFPHRIAAQQFSAWSAPVNVNNMALSDGTVCPAVVNSTSPDSNDTHATLSKDGLSLYFASTRPGPDSNGQVGLGNYDLWVTHRSSLDDCWQTPVSLGSKVNSAFTDFAPNLSPDGHWLFFHSKRQGGCYGGGSTGPAELWVTHRDTLDDSSWGTPINLGCTINDPGTINVAGKNAIVDHAGPTYFQDETTGTHFLYFTRGVMPLPDSYDIYLSKCEAPNDLAACNMQGLWGAGTLVDALNSPVRDTRTTIRRDGLEMIISSGRTGSLGFENLWVSTRPAVTLDQGNWASPEPVNCDDKTGFTSPNTQMFVTCSPWNPQGPPVNSGAFDGGPVLSWDGTELYFFRVRAQNLNLVTCTEGDDQDTLATPDTGPFCRDLYVTERKYMTNTVLSSSANPSVFGQLVTFTAAVSSANDIAPTGTVAFSDESASLGAGTLASGQATFTTSSLAIGSHSIAGKYGGDRISSGSSGSLTQNVEYGVCALFEQTRSAHSGATFPIKLQLCDANGNNVSSPAIVVHATSVSTVSGFSGTPDSPGNADPDNDFRFDPTIGTSGGYIFNLSTAGLASGTYSLQFTAGSDPVTHSVNFGVN